VIWALLATAWAQDARASGFAELRAAFTAGTEGTVWQLVERARPTLQVPAGEHVLFSATAELQFQQGRNLQTELERTITDSSLGEAFSGLCTWPEEDNTALNISRVSDYLFLDRLYMDVYTKHVDFRIGRQALQWGSGLLVNPTDPLPQVLFAEPWLPRAGINSIRAIVPIGERHEVQAVLATDDLLRNVRAAARGTLNVGGFDLSLVGAYRQDANDGIVGLDVRGTAGVGLWFEGALHVGEGGYGTGLYEELVVGLDYSVPVLRGLYFAGQYIRSGRQADALAVGRIADQVDLPDCDGLDITEALGVETDPTPFQPALSGNHYAMLVTRFEFLQELSLNAIWLQNMGDGTGIVVPTITTRPTGFLDIALSAQVPVRVWGDGGEFSPAAADLRFEAPLGLGSVDLGGLVPEATFVVWTRASF
jgi:hypothetical protein